MKFYSIAMVSSAVSMVVLTGGSFYDFAWAATIKSHVNAPDTHQQVMRTTKKIASATELPSGFANYSDVYQHIGPLLAAQSTVPVLLPSPTTEYETMENWLNVQYDTQSGYSLTVSVGPKLPANSPKIITGNANLLFTLSGLPKRDAIPLGFQWDRMSAVILDAKTRSVSLGHGITGILYTGTLDGLEEHNIVWQENGWTFGFEAAASIPVTETISQVQQLVTDTIDLKLPSATGRCLYGMGSDCPSQALFNIGSNRYILYTCGWNALADISSLTPVRRPN